MLLIGVVLLTVAMATATPAIVAPFASQIFDAIAKDKTAENVIFSPASIQTCLALAYLGAEGSTASELQQGLQLEGDNKQAVAERFSKFLAKTKTGDAKLKIANRVYVDQHYDIAPQFNELAGKYFDSEAEKIKFAESVEAAAKINAWVENQTEHKIKNVMQPGSVDSNTAAVLVNAIYFKAKWLKTFDGYATKNREFFVSESSKVSVDMMFQKDSFLYGDLKDLGATAVEMFYVGTDLTMLVVLPKTIDGLSALETKLKDIDITKISNELRREEVRLQLPKFKLEFDISLKPVLQQLGMQTLFSSSADFSSLLATKEPLAISEVKHKAFIEVNEEGTEAAAATYAKVYPLSAIIGQTVYDFVADHPFYFAIKDKENVYFAGHVAQF